MGVFKNEVGRPSNEVKKKRFIIRLVIILLVLIIVCLVAYIVNDKLNNKTISNAVTTKEKEEYNVKKAEKIVQSVFGKQYKGDMQYLGYYNGNTNIFNEDFYKTLVSIRNANQTDEYTCIDIYKDAEKIKDVETNQYVYEIDGETCEKIYNYKDVKKVFDEKFKSGTLVKSSMNNISWFDEKYNYSEKENVYVLMGQGNGDVSTFIAGAYKLVEKDNKVYVTVAFNHFEYNAEGENELTSELSDGTVIENLEDYSSSATLSNGISDENLLTKYAEHMENYELEFEKIDGKYVFIKSKKI